MAKRGRKETALYIHEIPLHHNWFSGSWLPTLKVLRFHKGFQLVHGLHPVQTNRLWPRPTRTPPTTPPPCPTMYLQESLWAPFFEGRQSEFWWCIFCTHERDLILNCKPLPWIFLGFLRHTQSRNRDITKKLSTEVYRLGRCKHLNYCNRCVFPGRITAPAPNPRPQPRRCAQQEVAVFDVYFHFFKCDMSRPRDLPVCMFWAHSHSVLWYWGVYLKRDFVACTTISVSDS